MTMVYLGHKRFDAPLSISYTHQMILSENH